jgi:hypothetical protein
MRPSAFIAINDDTLTAGRISPGGRSATLAISFKSLHTKLLVNLFSQRDAVLAFCDPRWRMASIGD